MSLENKPVAAENQEPTPEELAPKFENLKNEDILLFTSKLNLKNLSDVVSAMEYMQRNDSKSSEQYVPSDELIQYMKDVRDGKRGVNYDEFRKLFPNEFSFGPLIATAENLAVHEVFEKDQELGMSKGEIFDELVAQGKLDDIVYSIDKIKGLPKQAVYKKILQSTDQYDATLLNSYSTDPELPVTEIAGRLMAKNDFLTLSKNLKAVPFIDQNWLSGEMIKKIDGQDGSAYDNSLVLDTVKNFRGDIAQSLVDSFIKKGEVEMVLKRVRNSELGEIDYNRVVISCLKSDKKLDWLNFNNALGETKKPLNDEVAQAIISANKFIDIDRGNFTGLSAKTLELKYRDSEAFDFKKNSDKFNVTPEEAKEILAKVRKEWTDARDAKYKEAA